MACFPLLCNVLRSTHVYWIFLVFSWFTWESLSACYVLSTFLCAGGCSPEQRCQFKSSGKIAIRQVRNVSNALRECLPIVSGEGVSASRGRLQSTIEAGSRAAGSLSQPIEHSRAKLAFAKVPKSTTAGGCHLTELPVAASLCKDNLSSALPWLLWRDGMQLTSCQEMQGTNNTPCNNYIPHLMQRSSGNVLKEGSRRLLPPDAKGTDVVVNHLEPHKWEKYPTDGQRSLGFRMIAWNRVTMPSLHCLPPDYMQEEWISVCLSHCCLRAAVNMS